MALDFRPACEADLDRLIEIHTCAFPDPRGIEARRRNFVDNPLGALGDLWVAVEGGAIRAHAFLFALEVWVGGARVRVGGVATVGVAPEARGRGLGSRLLAHLHGVAGARGDAATLLYAFRQGFYARAGYAAVTPYRRLRLHPASVPWAVELPVRPATGADRDALRACWEAEARRHTGVLVRGERTWEARIADEQRTWLVVEGDARGVEGYVSWTVSQSEPHAPTTLLVRELAACTDRAARSLWAIVGAQRDQVSEVRADVAADDPVEHALIDADRARAGDGEVEHVLGEVAGGPMLRAIGAARALEARGWAAEGSLTLSIGDGMGGEERVELVVREGHGRAAPAAAEPALRFDTPQAFTAVALGALAPSHAARLGWLHARDTRALALAGALFALPPYYSPDPF